MNHAERIIAIGASAGGVEALLRMAPGLSAQLAAPILVVLHIGAHRSHLPELLAAHGPCPAVLASDGVVPQRGVIYVAPPDQHLLLEAGALRLYRGPKEHHARPAINPLFRSAALDAGPRVIGVVLTGMLDDGAAGLQAIKACGGTAVVQDPADAMQPSMPMSALSGLAADHVCTLKAMPDLLNVLAGKPAPDPTHPSPSWLRLEHAMSLGKAGIDDLATIGSPSRFTCPDCGGALFELTVGRPVRFLCHTGHAFSLRSLASVQEQVMDEALWAGLRAMQEKEAILRRLATLRATAEPEAGAALFAEADHIAILIEQLRTVVTSVPSAALDDSDVAD